MTWNKVPNRTLTVTRRVLDQAQAARDWLATALHAAAEAPGIGYVGWAETHSELMPLTLGGPLPCGVLLRAEVRLTPTQSAHLTWDGRGWVVLEAADATDTTGRLFVVSETFLTTIGPPDARLRVQYDTAWTRDDRDGVHVLAPTVSRFVGFLHPLAQEH